jgi:AraC-like DNA-binding protein
MWHARPLRVARAAQLLVRVDEESHAMSCVYTTKDAPSNEAGAAWREVVASIFFDMELDLLHSEAFEGQAQCWDFGDLRLTRFESSAVRYQRLRRHCDGNEPQILVSVPLASTIEFEQLGRQIRCEPGQFLLEHSDAPYEFRYGERSDMWVLKVPEAMLQSRTGSASRFCAMQFNASEGVGKLFRDYLALMAQHAAIADPRFQALMGMQFTDLLGAVLEADPRVMQSSGSAVKSAHLARIEHFVRQNLTDFEMSPERVAGACNISVRYLHLLFKESGRTLSSWVRELRLQSAYELLQRGAVGVSVAQTAYQMGFNDHAQFSNAFRKQFGRSPSDVLREARIATSKF